MTAPTRGAVGTQPSDQVGATANAAPVKVEQAAADPQPALTSEIKPPNPPSAGTSTALGGVADSVEPRLGGMQSAPNGAIDQLQHTAGTQSIGGSLQPVPAQPGGLSAPAILASDTLAQSAPAPGMSVQQSGGAGFPTGPSSSPALADPRAFDPAGSAPVALGRPFNAIQSLGLAPLSAGIASLVGVADRAPHPRPAPGPGPRGPTSPPADGTGFSNSFFSSGLAALLLAALILAAAAMARRVRIAPACWRPVPFVSLLERPG